MAGYDHALLAAADSIIATEHVRIIQEKRQQAERTSDGQLLGRLVADECSVHTTTGDVYFEGPSQGYVLPGEQFYALLKDYMLDRLGEPELVTLAYQVWRFVTAVTLDEAIDCIAVVVTWIE